MSSSRNHGDSNGERLDRLDSESRNTGSNCRKHGNSNGNSNGNGNGSRNCNSLGNGHLMDGIRLGDLEGDTSDSDVGHNITATDLMLSMLQIESDGSDIASSSDVTPTHTKRKMKNIARKQKDLTVFDAILGARRSAKRVSSKEKIFTQRRNKAIENYSGPKAQVTATNKDQKRTLFKDNTRLLQTIKARLVVIWRMRELLSLDLS